ncbi:MAG TPA: hypothetical protein VFS92_07305, partial [Planctomycetota bacterium]|nr:hypothetical protein [Planctomycetota bacterium]
MAWAGVVGSLTIVLLSGCAFPSRLPFEDDDGAAPPPTGEREWSAFVSAGAWSVDSDGSGRSPSGRAEGPDGDGSALSLRGGATFDIPQKPQEGVLQSSNIFSVPEGWRPCWGIEGEYTATKTSGGGTTDADLHVNSYSLLFPLGLRRPGLRPGEDEHRVDLLLGVAFHDARIDSQLLDAIGGDDSVSVTALDFGLRGHTTIAGPAFLFGQVEFGRTSSSFFDEVKQEILSWRLGAGARLGGGVTLQAGW